MKEFVANLLCRLLRKQPADKLAVTSAGLQYINSVEYEKTMIELVQRNYEPDESFYELLVGVTASFLCEVDPHGEDISVFNGFINANMTHIRAAIDRVKMSQPQIGYAEHEWVKAGRAGRGKTQCV